LPQLCRTLRLRLLCASRNATWPDESIESGHYAEGLGKKFVVGDLTWMKAKNGSQSKQLSVS